MAGLTALSSISSAAITLRRDAVLPIEFVTDMNVKNTKPGDHFTVRVVPGLEVPYGTKLEGRVLSVRMPDENTKASMDLEFTQIILPDGTVRDIRAVPVPMSATKRDRDGRLVSNRDSRKTEKYALGGALGGMLLGSFKKKAVEGALLGGIIGGVAAEATRNKEEATVVSKGQKFGALIEREVVLDYRGDRPGSDRDRDDDRDRDPIRVYGPDGEWRFGERTSPYYLGDVLMIPLKDAARELDLDLETGRADVMYLYGKHTSLRIERNSDQARLNGDRVTLSRPVQERDGELYLPIDVLRKLSSETINVRGNSRF